MKLKDFICILFLFSSLFAEEIKFSEGMRQEDFALLIVKEAEIEYLLPTPLTFEDCFRLLSEWGIEPRNGWEKGGIITKEDLLYMLDWSEEELENLSFEELSKKLGESLSAIATYYEEE